MDRPLPAWFKADNVFSHRGRWYFGCQNSLHVGPYRDRKTAEATSLKVTARLRSLRSERQRLDYVRDLLRDEWTAIAPKQKPGEPRGRAARGEAGVDLSPPVPTVRAGETQRSWFRSERFFAVEGVWFFTTREGVEVGPFSSKAEAQHHERRLVKLLAKAETPHQAHRIAYEYKHRPDFGGDIVYSQSDAPGRRH